MRINPAARGWTARGLGLGVLLAAACVPDPVAANDAAPAGPKLPPLALVKSAPKGSLKNPYTDAMPAVVARGETLFQSSSCSACHGPKGAGALCPPVTNDIWVYGGDDDTLFRLVVLGSDQLQQQGYNRTGHENIVASMPPFGGAIASADDLWAIITFIRAQFAGDAQRKFGAAPPGAAPATPAAR